MLGKAIILLVTQHTNEKSDFYLQNYQILDVFGQFRLFLRSGSHLVTKKSSLNARLVTNVTAIGGPVRAESIFFGDVGHFSANSGL